MATDEIIRVLLVEDSSSDALIVHHGLAEMTGVKFEVTHVERLAEAIKQLQAHTYEAILLDLSLPDSDGYETFAGVRAAAGDIPVLVLSGRADEELAVKAVQAGAQDYLMKGHMEERVLARAVRHAIERKRGAAALRESELKFRNVVHALPAAIYTCDAEGRITLFNQAAAELWGRQPDLDRERWCGSWKISDPTGAAVPHDTCPMARAVKTGTSDGPREIVVERPDGTRRQGLAYPVPIRDSKGVVTGAINMIVDVTEQKKLEEQSLRAQRLESIGLLAAGITHDLNNVLAPIGMAATLLRDRLSATSDLRLIDTLEKCAERGANLVRQILGFAHGLGTEPGIVQAAHLLRDVTEVVAETFPKSIALREEIDRDLLPILANPTQIHQVVLNLCVNARDAMPRGGTLTLGAENCLLDEAAAAAIPGATPGSWLVIHVKDTGTGIAPEVVARMWDPFFSTKSPGKGTGLGLSTVRGIVATCHGFTTLQTEVGRGTRISAYLPAAPSFVADTAGLLPHVSERGHGELILLVDDEELIRNLVSAILTRAGYRVITAADGVEATRAFESNSSGIDLVITDLDMPNVGGEALARAIHSFKPELKILAMSGAGSRQMMSNPAEFATAFIPKPFAAEVLLTEVEDALNWVNVPA